MLPLRRIAGHHRADADGSSEPFVSTLSAVRAPPLAALLVAARLRLAARLSRSAPPVLRALLASSASREWKAELLADLSVFHLVMADKLADFPLPYMDCGEYQRVWRSVPSAWAALVRLFVKRAGSSAAIGGLIAGRFGVFRGGVGHVPPPTCCCGSTWSWRWRGQARGLVRLL